MASAIFARRNTLSLGGSSAGQAFRVAVTVPASSVTESLTGFHTSVKLQLDPAHASIDNPYVLDTSGNTLAIDLVSWDYTTGYVDMVVRLDLSASADTTILVYYGG